MALIWMQLENQSIGFLGNSNLHEPIMSLDFVRIPRKPFLCGFSNYNHIVLTVAVFGKSHIYVIFCIMRIFIDYIIKVDKT